MSKRGKRSVGSEALARLVGYLKKNPVSRVSAEREGVVLNRWHGFAVSGTGSAE